MYYLYEKFKEFKKLEFNNSRTKIKEISVKKIIINEMKWSKAWKKIFKG